jgi:hypothetical protein
MGDRFKMGLQGIRSSISSATSATAEGSDSEARSSKDNLSERPEVVSSLFAWAEKAKKAVADNVKVAYEPVASQDGDAAADSSDVEKGEAPAIFGMLAKAATGVRKQAERAAEDAQRGLKQGVQKARTLEFDLGDPAARVTQGMNQFARSASTVSEAATQKASEITSKAAELKDKSAQKLTEAKSNAADKARIAKDKASSVAGAAKNKLSEAGQSVTGAVGGLATLTMSPVKTAQFIAIFFVGIMLITLSFTFLPVLVISPQKFALLFAFGSLVIMGSLAFLKGPKALASQLMQREKLPFSGTYIVGLVGTLVATIILRSFILTAIFGIMQAVALLYFLASYVPGGKAVLNFCGKCTSRLTAKLVCRRQ